MVLPTREISATGGKIRGQVDKTTFNIQMLNPERYEEMINTNADFQREAKAEFLRTVFTIHKYLVRISPFDTGELRGGWAGLLKKYNQDFYVELLDSSLYDSWKATNKTPEGREYHFSQDSVNTGISQSTVEELSLDITVINNVPQADYMEFGTSKTQGRATTEIARYKGEFYFNQVFDIWFNEMSKAGKVVSPAPQNNKQLV